MTTQTQIRTLHLHGLRRVDVAVVEIFLKLTQLKTRCSWQLVADLGAGVDLVLAPPQCPDLARVQALSGVLVWVTARGQAALDDGRPHLQQPLQMEAFLELLHAAELQPARFTHSAPALPPLGAGAVPVSAPTSVPASAPVRQPASTAAQVLELKQGIDGAAKYRLKRWPCAQSLSCNRCYSRLASFLSARYLTLAELVMLSNVEWQHCAGFMNQMMGEGLLEARAPQVGAQPSAAMQAAQPASAPRARVAAGVRPQASTCADAPVPGLIGRLRERLGLGGMSMAR